MLEPFDKELLRQEALGQEGSSTAIDFVGTEVLGEIAANRSIIMTFARQISYFRSSFQTKRKLFLET